MSGAVVLTVTRDVAAPPGAVFDAWLDPAIARRFLFATPGGEMTTCEIDPRVGGDGLIVERRADGEARHRFRFEEIDCPRQLVFLFAAGAAAEDEWTRVTVDVVAQDGGTRLTLTHETAPEWAAYADSTRHGWMTILGSLARILESDDDR